jgi:hypothetical protein
MNMAVVWVVAPCVLAASIVRAIGLMKEAACASETSVNFYQTARGYDPDDRHLYGNKSWGFRKDGEFLD